MYRNVHLTLSLFALQFYVDPVIPFDIGAFGGNESDDIDADHTYDPTKGF